MNRTMVKKTMTNMLLVLVVPFLWFTSGCAAKATRMVPADFEIAHRFPATVTVNESAGGIETNPLWTSQISNSAFTQALSSALIKSGVFQDIMKGTDADYILDVTILDYNKPEAGIDFYITIITKWELTNAKTLVPVWSETFSTTYHAKFSEALLGPERLQKANEGAVRENLKEGIRRLSLLNLKTE